MDRDARIVVEGRNVVYLRSGHGDNGNAGDLTAFRDYLVTLQKAVADAQSQRLTGDALGVTAFTLT